MFRIDGNAVAISIKDGCIKRLIVIDVEQMLE